MITQSINLSMNSSEVKPCVYVSQFDNGTRSLKINLLSESEYYEIPSGTVIWINGMKSDKKVFTNACTWSGHTVSVDVLNSMTNVPGTTECELSLYSGDNLIGSVNFYLVVERAPHYYCSLSKNDFTALNKVITDAESKAAELQQVVQEPGYTEIMNQIAALGKKVNARKILFLGDSYDVIHNTSVSGTCANCLGLTTSDWVKISVSSYGFAPNYTGLTNNTYISLLQNYVGAHTEDELKEFTDFVVFGGANDTNTDSTTLSSAISTVATYVRQHLPNARLYLGFVGWTRENAKHSLYSNTRDYYYAAAAQYGYSYLNNIEYILHNYNYLMTTENNIHHPTEDGVRALGVAMAECLLSGTCHARYKESISFTSAVSYGCVINAGISIQDDRGFITFSDFMLNANSSTDGLPHGAWSKVATYNTNLLKSTISAKMPCTGNTTGEQGYVLIEFTSDGNVRIAQFVSKNTPKNQLYMIGQSTPDIQFATMNN